MSYAKLALGLFIFSLIMGCATPEPSEKPFSGDAMARLADRMRESGDYPSAIRLYRQSLLLDAQNKDAQSGLAAALRGDKKYAECQEVLAKILEKDPMDEFTLRELGRIAILQHDAPLCGQTYQRLLTLLPQNAQVLNGYAICYDLDNRHHQAQTFYQQAMVLDPEDIDIKANYGLSLALAGKTTQAISLLERLSHRSNATPHVRHNFAVAQGLAGHLEKAETLFRRDLLPDAVDRNMMVLENLREGSKEQEKSESVSILSKSSR